MTESIVSPRELAVRFRGCTNESLVAARSLPRRRPHAGGSSSVNVGRSQTGAGLALGVEAAANTPRTHDKGTDTKIVLLRGA